MDDGGEIEAVLEGGTEKKKRKTRKKEEVERREVGRIGRIGRWVMGE